MNDRPALAERCDKTIEVIDGQVVDHSGPKGSQRRGKPEGQRRSGLTATVRWRTDSSRACAQTLTMQVLGFDVVGMTCCGWIRAE